MPILPLTCLPVSFREIFRFFAIFAIAFASSFQYFVLAASFSIRQFIIFRASHFSFDSALQLYRCLSTLFRHR